MCRDSHIRIYDPRHCTEPIQQGNGPVGVRGARILWALGGKYLVTVGFSKLVPLSTLFFVTNLTFWWYYFRKGLTNNHYLKVVCDM